MINKSSGSLSKKIKPISGQTAGAGAGRAPTGGGAGLAGGGAVTDKQHDAVQTMQSIMGKLQTDLQTQSVAQKAQQQLPNKDKYDDWQALATEARSWGSTSAGGTTGTLDGIWGKNTKAALARIKQFVADTGIQGIMIREGQGASPYREMEDAAVIKAANDNITNLARLFVALGMAVPAEAKGQGGSGYVLDQIPTELTAEAATSDNVWPEFWGEQLVTVGDLRSFSRFFQLLMRLNYTACQPLEGEDREIQEAAKDRRRENRLPEGVGAGREKPESDEEEIDVGYADEGVAGDLGDTGPLALSTLAKEILGNTIVRLSVDPAAVDPEEIGDEGKDPQHTSEEYNTNQDYRGSAHGETGTGEAGETTPEPAGMGVICFYSIDDFLRWFSARAASVYRQLYYARQEPRSNPRPDRGGAVTDIDLKAALAYQAAIAKLMEVWSDMKDDVLGQIRDADEPVVTLSMIRNAGGLGLGGPGASRIGRGRSGVGAGPGGRTIPGVGGYDYVNEGPMHRVMPLEWMVAQGITSMHPKVRELKSLSIDSLPDLNYNEWYGGDWVSIALDNVKGESNAAQLYNFPNWANTLREALRQIYVKWRDDNIAHKDRKIIARQDQLWRDWSQVIRSLISQAHAGMGPAIAEAEKTDRESFEPASKTRQRQEERQPARPAPAARQAPQTRPMGKREQRQYDKTQALKQRLERKKLRRENRR